MNSIVQNLNYLGFAPTGTCFAALLDGSDGSFDSSYSITVYCFPAKQKSKFENQQMAFFQLAALYLR